jgi:hypothetical protein
MEKWCVVQKSKKKKVVDRWCCLIIIEDKVIKTI